MSAQIPLGLALPKRPARGRAAFHVSASNANAVALIDGWRNWPNRVLSLTGPEGAGKTHLAHVWA
ncbi:MAG: chromosomal replication initiator DnaA, partial [Pikeienuella sp.]